MHRSTSFVSAPLGPEGLSSRATKSRRPHANNGSGALIMICGLSAAVLFTIYTMIQPRIQLHQKAKLNFTIQGGSVQHMTGHCEAYDPSLLTSSQPPSRLSTHLSTCWGVSNLAREGAGQKNLPFIWMQEVVYLTIRSEQLSWLQSCTFFLDLIKSMSKTFSFSLKKQFRCAVPLHLPQFDKTVISEWFS